jgi:hypothetical protein
MQTRDEEIGHLQALLASATTYQQTADGSASFDLQAAERRLSQLLNANALEGAGGVISPRNFAVDLSGAGV